MRFSFSTRATSQFVFLALALTQGSALAKDILVKTKSDYKRAVKKAEPGDVIQLANGDWKNFEIVFKAQGTKEEPITLTAETKGQVFLTGNSNLRIAGEHLVVSGLVFKDGFTPTGEVISFRRNKKDLAFHSRVTEVVIDNFSNPDKFESDKWVAMYGQHNRFDHNHLSGKKNAGVTMAVRLDAKESRENHHRIDHNYFGPRPVLGSNGGETLRIGTSKYSLSDSKTTVENNYFDRCNGEVEIISNKAGANKIINNTFFESRGTLTLRHGNGNLVEGNVFFGNGVDHTGGIRVINSDQIVRNNYMEGLKGYRFGSAFVVMNGVPNSTINRYHQVNNALVENNTLVDVDHIHLAAGSDAERSAVPVNSRFENNLIVNNKAKHPIFTIFDDVSGIALTRNVLSQHIDSPTSPSTSTPTPAYALEFEKNQGMRHKKVEMARRENGLLYPTDKTFAGVGVSATLTPTLKQETGVSWYPKADPDVAFDSGKTTKVDASGEALIAAIDAAQTGDTLILSAGTYAMHKVIKLDKTLSIKAEKPGQVVIALYRSTLLEILDFGSIKFDNITFDGKTAPDSAGNAVIRTSRIPMLTNYRLSLHNSVVKHLNINHSYHFIDAGNRSFADDITIDNTSFSDVTGDILRLNKETDDLGIYNAEYVTLTNNTFTNIEGAVVKLYRGGTDESTFGPHFLFDNNTLTNIGHGKRNKSKAALSLHGVQVNTINNNQLANTKGIVIEHTVGEPNTVVSNNTFENTPETAISELNQDGPHTAKLFNNKAVENSEEKR